MIDERSNGATADRLVRESEVRAAVLLEAYRTGTPEALEAHYRLTWHRRAWPAMRTYIQLDLGKRPTTPAGDVEITLDDARFLVAKEQGFADWAALCTYAVTSRGESSRLDAPVRVMPTAEEDAPALLMTRDWEAALRALEAHPGAVLDVNGQMTDAMLADVVAIPHVRALRLSNAKALTNEGLQQLARLPRLTHLDLSQTAVTDDGLRVVRELPMLESLSLTQTAVTDAGIEHLADCHALRRLNLMWTRTGDGAIAALAGKASLTHFASGNLVTNAGIGLIHGLPAFRSWSGTQPTLELLSPDADANMLTLRGTFTDAGLEQLRGLNGLFGLNLDDRALQITARGMVPLASLPHLGRLAVDAQDDWMPIIAAMPALRFLSAQDTSAGDDGFVALSASQTLEYLWGRRCHNLRSRGFAALRNLPKLRALSVSCLNVGDDAIALLPEFPSLRELMPMDVPDAGYRHIGRCANLEALTLMYCRDTTDAATEQIVGLTQLRRYFNSYTTITDRTPQSLSTMDSLEEVTFDGCHGLTNDGVTALARLPRLQRLRLSGNGLSADVSMRFPSRITVHYSP